MEYIVIALIGLLIFVSAALRAIASALRPTPRPPAAWYLATKDAQQHSRTLADEEQMVRGIARRALEKNRKAWLKQEGGQDS